MGTPGHMAHPFDTERVRTGQDLIDYINSVVVRLRAGEIVGSVKWEGINVSVKVVTTEDGGKEFRMDRGTNDPDSVRGYTAKSALQKWEPPHGMGTAIVKVLSIYNSALPSIEEELKELGMWDDPTKYFNQEYIEGRSNVIEYNQNIIAIHGVNQFYEKKGQPWRMRRGLHLDRPGLSRPMDADGRPIKAGGVEIDYNPETLERVIEALKPYAEKEGFVVYGDVPVEFDPNLELNLDEVLETPVSIQIRPGETQTESLRNWLQSVEHPRDKKILKVVRDANGNVVGQKEVGALSKDIYLAVLRSARKDGIPLSEYLTSEEYIQDAINGGIFYHGTRLLGQAVKDVLTSEAGSLSRHEGVVLRGMEDFLIKLTGDFIIQGLASTHGTHTDASDITEYLSKDFVIKVSKNRTITKTLKEWMKEIEETNHKYQKPPEFVYNDILNGVPITEIVKQDFAQEMIYNTILRYTGKLYLEQENEDADPVIDIEVADEPAGRLYALVPGSMKPPTLGHAGMIEAYSEMIAQADPKGRVLVFVSKPTARGSKGELKSARGFPGRPEGITQTEAMGILKIMLPEEILEPTGNVVIVPTDHASPMSPVYDFLSPNDIPDVPQAVPGDEVILGASTKGGDASRWNDIINNKETRVRPGVAVRSTPVEPVVHQESFLTLIRSEEAQDIMEKLPTLVKARKKAGGEIPEANIPEILSNISASDARHIMGFMGTDKEEIALQLLDAFFGDKTATVLAHLGFRSPEGGGLEEMSSGSGGGLHGAPGIQRKRKRTIRKENKQTVDDVIRLLMERGIMS